VSDFRAPSVAYPGNQAGDITVRSTPGRSGEIVFEIVDRGLGGPPESHYTGQQLRHPPDARLSQSGEYRFELRYRIRPSISWPVGSARGATGGYSRI